ncbi:hypothetical protein Tmar_2060 [Thermaerobacter marianensis DSM 12885]|uniref:Uncharacterized protein n=1 Tax=Thermaerobacter marianensis (strain ATCC 700841 / DSM 12885 / JCM 10246 / 7p75a) TaxID=644966 RepID=E6SJI6_THEM7|nr:hypothetical protein [Thermaerobacter marianensis]ADU52141.1 hypothetical protein Tmar_2060 [Thermaerobacter marianensis DSM 12885]
MIRIPVSEWWFPLAAAGWVAILYALPLALGLALARVADPRAPRPAGTPDGAPEIPLTAGAPRELRAPRAPRSWPAGTTGGRGLAAGFFTYLWMANLQATLGLGVEGPGWMQALWLQAAFLAAFLIPAYLGWMRPGGRVGRRVGWTWAIALGLDGAAGAWTVRAALEAGGLLLAPAAALAGSRMALGWGLGLLLAEGRRPARRGLLAAGLVAGVPPLAVGALPAGAGLVAWSLVLRAAVAGLILAGLAGGRLVPGARRRRGEAQWAFTLAMAAAMALMLVLARWQAMPLSP